MDKYSRVLYWSAEVPELEFCAADGPTPQGALAEVENAVQRSAKKETRREGG